MTISEKELVMSFDPNVITHLGLNMYSSMPPVIAELVANAYDAEATIVEIEFIDNDEKEIILSDNGHGMIFKEINDKFLQIGRNRRLDEEKGEFSKNKKRKVIGKKGLGKLAFFGVAEEIIIETVCEGIKNVFRLDWNELQNQGNQEKKYNPELIEYNISSKENNRTTIKLKRLKRKSAFNIDSLAISLSKYFTIFDGSDFKVVLKYNNKIIEMTNKLKYEKFNMEFSIKIPEDIKDEDLKNYFSERSINGILFSSQKTILEKDRGIALFSRGKLVNKPSFYDIKATSHGYAYITGYLNVDFIDEIREELISTNRQSLNWECEIARRLRTSLSELIRSFFNEVKKIKEDKKKNNIKTLYGVDVDNWLNGLPKYERKLANKIVKSIIKSEGIDEEKSSELIKFTMDSFRFESFKELAHDIEESKISDPIKLIDLFKEWQVIESRELYKIAKIRIETIKKFKQHIEENSKEVPELHNFLREFPWILDPRIMNFKDEVTYSKLLKEKFGSELIKGESNKRIDFLCVDFSESLFIIELKRPKSIISDKNLDQALEYVSFIEKKIGNEFPKKVYCIIVGGKLSDTPKTQKKAEAYKNNNDAYFKSYSDLLKNAKNYHKEFIEKYEELNNV